MKKITLRTLKSFINKNKENLKIQFKQRFDGMDDSLSSVKEKYQDAEFVSKFSYFKSFVKYYKENNNECFFALNKEDKIRDLNNRYEAFLKDNLGLKQKPYINERNIIEDFEDENYKGFIVFNYMNKVVFAVEKTA